MIPIQTNSLPTTMDKIMVHTPPKSRLTSLKSLLAAVLLVVASATYYSATLDWGHAGSATVPVNAAQIIQKCQALHILPRPPSNFDQRIQSDRFETGTPPTLFRNASIWTGRISGHEVIVGDLLLDRGIIKEVGQIKRGVLNAYDDLIIIDVGGAWITPGYVRPLLSKIPLKLNRTKKGLLTSTLIWVLIAHQRCRVRAIPILSRVWSFPGSEVWTVSIPTTRPISYLYLEGLLLQMCSRAPLMR